MNRSGITWCDFTWNPITGCTKGCEYCYARKTARRIYLMQGIGSHPDVAEVHAHYDLNGSASTAPRNLACPSGFYPTIYPHRLDEPRHRKKPSIIFLGSMGDLFDPAFPDEFRDRVFMTTLLARQHTFLLLTKQVENMHRYFSDPDRASAIFLVQPNLWLGVTVTNQADADERIPLLLDTPAAHRFVSVEPMLGPVDFDGLWGYSGSADSTQLAAWPIHLVIVGAKTPGKPLHEQNCIACRATDAQCDRCEPFGGDSPSWNLVHLRDQCVAAGVPFHYKHGGTNPPLDGVIYDWKPGDAS